MHRDYSLPYTQTRQFQFLGPEMPWVLLECPQGHTSTGRGSGSTEVRVSLSVGLYAFSLSNLPSTFLHCFLNNLVPQSPLL